MEPHESPPGQQSSDGDSELFWGNIGVILGLHWCDTWGSIGIVGNTMETTV